MRGNSATIKANRAAAASILSIANLLTASEMTAKRKPKRIEVRNDALPSLNSFYPQEFPLLNEKKRSGHFISIKFALFYSTWLLWFFEESGGLFSEHVKIRLTFFVIHLWFFQGILDFLRLLEDEDYIELFDVLFFYY